jgi:sarcosine oxidase subunit beta
MNLSTKQNESRAEIVIIGGGIYGTSLAYELATAGRDVMLLEAGEIAGGASGGPGERGVRANGRDIRELTVVRRAIERWEHYQSFFDNGVGYRKIGGFELFDIPHGYHEHEVRGKMQAGALVQNRMGVRTELLSREATLEREPELSGSIAGGLFCPDDGVCDHTFATQQFASHAVRAGAVLRSHAAVSRIVQEKGAAVGVELSSGEFVAVTGQLIVLANTAVPGLLAPFATKDELAPVWNLMPQMMFVTNPRGAKINHLHSHAHKRLSVKQMPDGTVMLSGGVSVAHLADGTTRGALTAISINLADAISVLPFLDDSSFIRVDATRADSVAVDAIPIVGRPAALQNVIFGYAWSGHGFAISLGFTELFREWIVSGQKPAALEVFSNARFNG